MTPEKLGVWVALGGLVFSVIGSVLGYILHLKDEAQAREISRVSEALKAAFAQIDKLKEERTLYATKTDAAQLRAEIKTDIKELGDRLIGEIDRLLRAKGD